MSTPQLADAVVAPPLRTHDPAPGAARRWLARFALIAFGLYHLPLLLNDYPTFGGGGGSDDGIAIEWGHVFCQPGLWIARHIFGLTGPMPDALRGDNGDTAEEYCRLLLAVVIAVIAAAIWTRRDRRRPRAAWVEPALRVLLRYAIALGLASYAVAKLYPAQFYGLTPMRLEARVGELTPFQLLWGFMQYSRVYSTIAGVMELTVVLLLCFRRTATLGALLCIPVMLNVMLMNLCYNVPVKLYSTMTVVSALVLVLYDARRLFDLLVRHRGVAADPLAPPFQSRRLNRARWIVKLALVGGVLLSSAVEADRAYAHYRADDASPLHGSWDVTSLVVAGRDITQTTELTRWRIVSFGPGGASLRLEDQTRVTCGATIDTAAHLLSLQCPSPAHSATFYWTRDGYQLHLFGQLGSAPARATLTLRSDAELPLLRTRFAWTYS